MTIKFVDEKTFYDGIFELVKRGLQFDADHTYLKITLTGGY